MEIYAAYDDLNGIQIFSDKPDRVNFGNGNEWTGYPVENLLTDVRTKIFALKELKSLTYYDDPVKIAIDISIHIVD